MWLWLLFSLFLFSVGLHSHPIAGKFYYTFFVRVFIGFRLFEAWLRFCCFSWSVFGAFSLSHSAFFMCIFRHRLHNFSRVKQFIQWHSNLLLYNFRRCFLSLYLSSISLSIFRSIRLQVHFWRFTSAAHFSWFCKTCTRQPYIFLIFNLWLF